MMGNGNLYGTTAGGGTECGHGGCGIVFELTPNSKGEWTEAVLYSFLGGDNDGVDPHSTPVMDAAGNLYGTTVEGGPYYTSGTVFELTPGSDGWSEQVLLFFDGSDGAAPTAGLLTDSVGDLYGTAPGGGPNTGGVAYTLSPGSGGWNETILNAFYYYGYGAPGGSNPYAGVILDASGNLYGTTYDGGGAPGAATRAAASRMS
jgi:hypothetical protein